MKRIQTVFVWLRYGLVARAIPSVIRRRSKSRFSFLTGWNSVCEKVIHATPKMKLLWYQWGNWRFQAEAPPLDCLGLWVLGLPTWSLHCSSRSYHWHSDDSRRVCCRQLTPPLATFLPGRPGLTSSLFMTVSFCGRDRGFTPAEAEGTPKLLGFPTGDYPIPAGPLNIIF